MTTQQTAAQPKVLPMAGLSLQEVQAHTGGVVSGDANVRIRGINAVEAAGPGELTFAESSKYLPQVRDSRASAVIVPVTFPAVVGRTLLRVEHPRLAFIKVMHLFQPPVLSHSGVDRHAVIAPDAELGEGVTIRECAVVRSHARIGRGTIIESGAHIGNGVIIGQHCFIGPNVVIMHGSRIGNRVIIHGGTVIGADGFGFVWVDKQYVKVPQIGNVVIEDDVELGANVCVDRATLGSTIIKRGTKIDNLVQIAHNDVVGEDVAISGQVGLAGSVQIGNRVILGGQVGIADHLTVGDDARIGAGSGVIKNVRSGETVWWFPARPIERVKRELAALAFLPELVKKFRHQKTLKRHKPRRPVKHHRAKR